MTVTLSDCTPVVPALKQLLVVAVPRTLLRDAYLAPALHNALPARSPDTDCSS